MAMSTETLTAGIVPLLTGLGLGLYDAEINRGTVKITVTKPAGVGIDELSAANAAVSLWLDEHEPFENRYTLEITSPGVERPLRTPAHFASAVGETAKLKVTPELSESRRLEGTIISADQRGLVLETVSGRLEVPFDQVERARTTYVWGPAPKPSPSRAGAPKGPKRTPTTNTQERIRVP